MHLGNFLVTRETSSPSMQKAETTEINSMLLSPNKELKDAWFNWQAKKSKRKKENNS